MPVVLSRQPAIPLFVSLRVDMRIIRRMSSSGRVLCGVAGVNGANSCTIAPLVCPWAYSIASVKPCLTLCNVLSFKLLSSATGQQLAGFLPATPPASPAEDSPRPASAQCFDGLRLDRSCLSRYLLTTLPWFRVGQVLHSRSQDAQTGIDRF